MQNKEPASFFYRSQHSSLGCGPRLPGRPYSFVFGTGGRIRSKPLKIEPIRPRSLNRILEQSGWGLLSESKGVGNHR